LSDYWPKRGVVVPQLTRYSYKTCKESVEIFEEMPRFEGIENRDAFRHWRALKIVEEYAQIFEN
jgi:hypothetical protein